MAVIAMTNVASTGISKSWYQWTGVYWSHFCGLGSLCFPLVNFRNAPVKIILQWSGMYTFTPQSCGKTQKTSDYHTDSTYLTGMGLRKVTHLKIRICIQCTTSREWVVMKVLTPVSIRIRDNFSTQSTSKYVCLPAHHTKLKRERHTTCIQLLRSTIVGCRNLSHDGRL